MREIKFRGWDEQYKTWIFGDLRLNEAGDKAIITPRKDGYLVPCSVDRNTVGQFTGLHDANGVDIYEGDLLQKRDELAWRTVDRGCVFWNGSECRWCVEMRDGLKFSLTSRKSDSWRVIGNVHDSPELLEGKDARD